MHTNTYSNTYLSHHGIMGMKWGVRRFQNKDGSLTRAGENRNNKPGRTTQKVNTKLMVQESLVKTAYSVGAKLNPRELKYAVRKVTNNPNSTTTVLAEYSDNLVKQTGTLPTNSKALKAVETMGIETHSKTRYDNLEKSDIANLKTYTDSARYSRSVNGYLAIGDPKAYAREAAKLKATLNKNDVSDVTVYRSCNFKFSTNGVAKKMDTFSEKELSTMFDKMSGNFAGKSLSENRVFSTSTSPLFAIDTWRKVNPTAASTYNTYMIINCKKCPGVLADGKTTSGKALVNTRSNQEAILAPNKLTYRKLAYDKERKMFAITCDAT